MIYHSTNINEILKQLNTSKDGLSNQEIKKRLQKDGLNILPKEKEKSIVKIFLSEFRDPIVIILIVAAILSYLVGETIDAIAILFIIMLDILMGTFQEWKALKSANALEKLIKVQVQVLRNKKITIIDSSNLVKGDIVLVESGSKISADLRIIECKNLTVDESSLTGESIAELKDSDNIDSQTILADRKNMLYAGTNIITGRAKCIVVEIGILTEIGKIANKVTQTKETKSPLTIRMERFSKQISILIILIAIIITILLWYKGFTGTEIFLAVIALSVSAMPEGLPLALTMALTIGANRMAKKNVIVKKLNAVESLGSCTVIASDKTGTLTVNEQTAKKIVLPNNHIFEIEGTGYNDQGNITTNKNYNLSEIIEICSLGNINNEAKLEKRHKKWQSFGDSIDIAFLALAKKTPDINHNMKILETIPYESENKYSAVYYEEDNKKYITAKGSLEKIFEFTTTMKINDKIVPIDKNVLTRQNEELAKQGYRVIALCNGKNNELKQLTFIGLVAFIDPIRKETINSIEECKNAGIKVVMVTGDHPLTAYSIAKELNIASSMEQVTTALEVEKVLKLGHKTFDEFIKNKRVFTRVTPLQKFEIIESYKRQQEFIAVTGDGVNDAPAIKSANIGIAMGSGTDVAKETAKMIIVDDNFMSIVAGIKAGRNAYSNIRKVSFMLLSCGVSEVLFFLLSVAFGLPIPLIAIQLLWLNLVTDGLQDFALSFEKSEKGIMLEKPRRTSESLFDKILLRETIFSGVLIGLIVFAAWLFLLKVLAFEPSIARGYIMVLMVFIQNIHVLNCRSEKTSTFKIPFKNSPFIFASIIGAIALQIIVMEVPIFATFLQTSSIPITHIIILFVLALPILLAVEIYKKIMYKKI
ncbi:MAG: cation-transporting P-type ATPase [Bacilli bacterium]